MIEGEPAPGKFVKQVAEEYRGTQVYHALYLPTNWRPGATYPVIVEYPPNKYRELAGRVEECRLGFHQSGGRDFLWVAMPFVDSAKKENAPWLWGDEKATADYCLTNLRRICERYGGDPSAVFLTGFSRGAIACGYIGLRDEAMADVWLAFLPHSHTDGGAFTPKGAKERLARTRGRPTFATYGSQDSGAPHSRKGIAILRELGFPFVERELPNLAHTDRWIEQDCPVRREMRAWMAGVLKDRPGTHTLRGRVVDPEGRAIAGVRVQCGTWHWAVTDADGGYTIPSLTPGRRRLVASKPGLAFAPAVQEVSIAGEDALAIPMTGRPAR